MDNKKLKPFFERTVVLREELCMNVSLPIGRELAATIPHCSQRAVKTTPATQLSKSMHVKISLNATYHNCPRRTEQIKYAFLQNLNGEEKSTE